MNLRTLLIQALAHSHLSLLALILGSTMAQAQMLPTSTSSDSPEKLIELKDPESKAAVREMVSKLSDDSVRALLIQRLDAVAEAKEAAAKDQASVEGIFRTGWNNWQQSAINSVTKANEIPSVLGQIKDLTLQSIAPQSGGKLFIFIALAIIVGLVAERIVATMFRKRKAELIAASSMTLWGILKILYSRLSMDVLGVLAFSFGSSIILGQFIGWGHAGYQFASLITSTIFAAWLAYVICRFFFAPKRPDLRICKTSDERAQRLTASFSVLAGYIVLIHHVWKIFFATILSESGGWETVRPLGFILNMSMYIAAAGVIWLNRHALTEILIENKKRVYLAIGAETTEELSWFAQHWPKIAVALIVLKYVLVEFVVNLTDVGVYSTAAVYTTFIVIFLWPGIDANVSLFVGRGIRAAEDETEAAGKSRRSMQQGLLRVGRVLVVCAVLYVLAALWGVNILDLAEAGLGAKIAGNLVELLLIALFAYVVWELLTIFTDSWLAKEGGAPSEHDEEPGGGDAGGVGLSRIATLIPIIRRTAQFMIVTVSIIMVLNNWGVNIGPLIAGAGVVGLAIGFGAQTLVKDIVSGLFFLADDAFRVGEYIDVGGTMGNVEKISLRSLRLRHHRGLVHTIPYGEIPKLTNFSRDWVIMKLRFRVPFDTDVNKIKKIFKGIGKDLLKDPILGEDFLQPFKSQGVAEVDDNGIVVRGKFMAKPGKQFMIRKEVYVRVQKAFEEAGIPFARKQVMVHIPGLDKGEELDKEALQTIGAAAAEDADDTPPAGTSPKPA